MAGARYAPFPHPSISESPSLPLQNGRSCVCVCPNSPFFPSPHVKGSFCTLFSSRPGAVCLLPPNYFPHQSLCTPSSLPQHGEGGGGEMCMSPSSSPHYWSRSYSGCQMLNSVGRTHKLDRGTVMGEGVNGCHQPVLESILNCRVA